MTATPLIEVKNLVKQFRLPGGWLSGGGRYVHAVSDVSLAVQRGEVLGLVGESGCGKTTLGRLMLMLIRPTAGQVIFAGDDLTAMSSEDLRRMRSRMQIVFQNPQASLSPRQKVEASVAEPLRTHRAVSHADIRDRVVELLEMVGLGVQHLSRFPHELSGGQCQRVAVARALALHPQLVVLDEPTSALDVSVQAQMINLLQELQRSQGLTYLFISHDLSVVQHVSDRIGVMYLGKLVEVSGSEAIFEDPLHPYTRALLGAIPQAEVGDVTELVMLEGSVPSPSDPPPGCRFHTRCPLAYDLCRTAEPPLREVRPQRWAACHLVE